MKRREAIKGIGATATLGAVPSVGTKAFCHYYCSGTRCYDLWETCQEKCGGCV